jgi:hypothetical protein
MPNRDTTVAVSIFALLMLFWLGFLLHQAPRFAGSAWGGFFGVTAAVFMLLPLAYSLVKRIPSLRRSLQPHLPMHSLLHAHVYFGLIGALLALIHTGHKFESALGVALTTSLLLTVVSGCIGQYYLRYVSDDIREKQVQLGVLWRTIEIKSQSFRSAPSGPAVSMQTAAQILPLATATAELQYAVQFQERVRRSFGSWLNVHIACSIIFYVLLVLHIWGGLYFGLRWFG